jgi:hypothetical protein
MRVDDAPAGYVRVTAGGRVAVALERHEADARQMLADGSLYESAERDPAARPLQGRGVAYAVSLPVTRTAAVVRHNRHGGLLAPLTSDLFLPPTRAPRELAIALRLQEHGVPTPAVLMYATSPALVLFRRADVVTQEIVGGRDLSSFMAPDVAATERTDAWEATRVLVRHLNAAGARHHDLNVKNVLLAPHGTGLTAYVLDVDRVTFAAPDSTEVAAGNASRLLRSARKWRAERGAVFDEREIARLGRSLERAS